MTKVNIKHKDVNPSRVDEFNLTYQTPQNKGYCSMFSVRVHDVDLTDIHAFL